SRVSPKGIEYNGDYSSGYSDRSLVDKEYVLSVIPTNIFSATENELIKYSSETSSVGTGIFSSSSGNVTLGHNTLPGVTRTINVEGSESSIELLLESKSIGGVTLKSGGTSLEVKNSEIYLNTESNQTIALLAGKKENGDGLPLFIGGQSLNEGVGTSVYIYGG